MNAYPEARPSRPRRLLNRFLHVRHHRTDDPSVPDPRVRRVDPPADVPPIETPDAKGASTWSQTRARRVPKSRSHPDPVQLPDSRAEAGGPPVYADPRMVTPAAAERMRPLFRKRG